MCWFYACKHRLTAISFDIILQVFLDKNSVVFIEKQEKRIVKKWQERVYLFVKQCVNIQVTPAILFSVNNMNVIWSLWHLKDLMNEN